MKKLLCILLITLLTCSTALATNETAMEAMEIMLAAECPDAKLMDADWIPAAPGMIIGTYALDEYIGVAIGQQRQDLSCMLSFHNDKLFPIREDADCFLSSWPEDEPRIWYVAPDEGYDLLIDQSQNGEWIVRHMVYSRNDPGIQYTFDEDEERLIVSEYAFPRIWWPVDAETLSLSTFDKAAVCAICDEAVDYMRKTNPLDLRIDYVAP